LVIKTTNEEERYNFALYEVREKELFGVNTGLKTATFLGKKIVDPYANKPPYWRKVSSLNQTMYSIYHMKNDTFKYYIDNLRKDPPVYITGYVNPIYQLAKYIIDNDITPLKVKAIFVSSETLHTWQKEFIEKAFSCEVCNGYSQAEGVSFISSCRNGNLHVHPDYGVTEFIKVEGTEYYEIVGTTLFNYAMPLIRYRTKDYVIFDEKQRCECGLPYFPIVKEIVGRNDSSIKSPSGKVISSAALSLIFKHFPQIKETQLIQEDDYRINVLLIIDGDINDEFGRDFTEELCSVIGEEFDIVLTKVELIPKSSSGKHKLIISKV
jgi:phenylacetate-CoA ligase